jgi:hypothetical protein
MKSAVFWDVTPCGSYKIRRFGETYRLHHQSGKNHSSNLQLKLLTEQSAGVHEAYNLAAICDPTV